MLASQLAVPADAPRSLRNCELIIESETHLGRSKSTSSLAPSERCQPAEFSPMSASHKSRRPSTATTTFFILQLVYSQNNTFSSFLNKKFFYREQCILKWNLAVLKMSLFCKVRNITVPQTVFISAKMVCLIQLQYLWLPIGSLLASAADNIEYFCSQTFPQQQPCSQCSGHSASIQCSYWKHTTCAAKFIGY